MFIKKKLSALAKRNCHQHLLRVSACHAARVRARKHHAAHARAIFFPLRDRELKQPAFDSALKNNGSLIEEHFSI